MKYLIITLSLGVSILTNGQDTIPNLENKTAIIIKWESVKITTLASDVEGLAYAGQVKGASLKAENHTYKEREAAVIKRLKKQAAAKGCSIILLASRKEEANKLTILGKAYK